MSPELTGEPLRFSCPWCDLPLWVHIRAQVDELRRHLDVEVDVTRDHEPPGDGRPASWDLGGNPSPDELLEGVELLGDQDVDDVDEAG